MTLVATRHGRAGGASSKWRRKNQRSSRCASPPAGIRSRTPSVRALESKLIAISAVKRTSLIHAKIVRLDAC
eukprot:5887428-Prymnesium_polylepis.2